MQWTSGFSYIPAEQSQRTWITINDARLESVHLTPVVFGNFLGKHRCRRPATPHEMLVVQYPTPAWILGVIGTRSPEIEDFITRVHRGPGIQLLLNRVFFAEQLTVTVKRYGRISRASGGRHRKLLHTILSRAHLGQVEPYIFSC